VWQIRSAIKAALASTSPNFRVGASAFRGSSHLASKCNRWRKVQRDSRLTGRGCAELRLASATDLEGSTVFVVRIGMDGKLRMSKPCEMCEKLLRKHGCSQVFFSTWKGTLEKMEL